MLDDATYTRYTETLKRDIVPDADTFNKYKVTEELYIKSIMPYLTEREEHGLDNALCMIIEEAYKADKSHADGRIEVSRSLDGFSQSFDVSKAKSLDTKKMEYIKLFCHVNTGVL